MSVLAITGLGMTTPIGQGKDEVQTALLDGRSAFRVMQRPGRQNDASAFLGAEIGPIRPLKALPPRLGRALSWGAEVSVATLSEAWSEARLDTIAPERVGIVVGGSNLQQRELVRLQESYGARSEFLPPTYGHKFMDTDLAAVCSEAFGIRGPAFTAGGASASGHLAIVLAARAVSSGQVDACVALGCPMDLSHWECQGFRNMGAMGSDRFAAEPDLACRPFDRSHDGFIFGENCAALVIEKANAARGPIYALLRGWSYLSEGARGPEPSLAGEIRAIEAALSASGWESGDIDYVNPHGTGSPTGDVVELRALASCGLSRTPINATKSLLGHGLSAAGAVEVGGTLLQMRAGAVHPTRNLLEPLDDSFNWVAREAGSHTIRKALTLSFAFGGVNSAICLENVA